MKNNSWLQKTAAFFLLSLTFLGFIACSEDKEDEIDYTQLTGLWEGEVHEEGKGTYTTLMHFKNDGTVTEYYAITSNGYYADTYTYTLNEGRLKIIDSDYGDVDEYSIRSLTSARLVLYDTYYNEEISYKRYYGNLPSGTQYNADNTDNGYGGGNNNGSNDEESTSINPPTNVQAYVNDGKVTITWQPVSGASSYSVWRSSSSNGSYSPLVYINSSTSYTDNWPSTGYNYYIVKANEHIGNGGMYIESDFSSYTSVYVEEKKENPDENEEIPDEKEETPIVKKPNAPTNVTVSNEGNDYYPDVVIRWDETNGADKYYVYRSSSAYGTYSKIATAQWNVYTDNTAPTSQASYYKVKAVNSAGESPYSSYAVYTPVDNDKAFAPGKPIWGSCTVSGTRVTLRWSYPTGNGYGVPTKAKLRAKLGGVNTWVDIKELSGTATSVTWDFSTGYVEFDGNKQYLYVGIVLENEKGTGSNARIYNITERKWVM